MQESYISDALGSHLLPSAIIQPDMVTIAEESFHEENFHGILKMEFVIILVRPSLVFNLDDVLKLYKGNTKSVNVLRTYLQARDHHDLKLEFKHGNGMISVDCIENLPPVVVSLGEHVFLTVGDYFLSSKI